MGRKRLHRRIAAWVAIAAVLAIVYSSYLNPNAIVDLSNWIWTCI